MPPKDFLAAACSTGVSTDTAQRALSHLEAGRVSLLALSGKPGSGKDTVAPAVMEALGIEDGAHLYYAIALKGEVDEVIRLVTTARTPDEASELVSTSQGVPRHQAAWMAGALWAATRSPDHTVTSRERTPIARALLQYWGTEVRRAQDPDYWVKVALRDALEVVADGRSVYFTDVRFQNEVTGAQSVGFTVVRLEVTPEVQRARLTSRDGTPPDESTLNHVAETGLDGYEGFDLVLDNSGPLAPTVETIVARLQSR